MYSRYGGGYGGGGGLYGSGLYSGYGMGMGMGLYGNMMGGVGGGMGGGGGLGNSVQQMFQMTQMMELNTMFLDQLQEQIAMIYQRCSQVGLWMFGVRDHFAYQKYDEMVRQYPPSSYNTSGIQSFASWEEKKNTLDRLRKRLRVITGLIALFLIYCWRKRRRELAALKMAQIVWHTMPKTVTGNLQFKRSNSK